MNQIELHKRIDELLGGDPAATDPEVVSSLFSEAEDAKAREDARHYFFTQADECWLGWLLENGFLDAIKEKAEDPTKYGYRMPELNYLVKVAAKKPEKVAEIVLDTPASEANFNPEVIAQFLRICTILPADQLARVVPKIEEDGWVQLMSDFNSWGFEYKEMLKKLYNEGYYDSLIILSRAILKVRSKDEVKSEGFAGISTENPFYLSDLSHTEVFENLSEVDDTHVEQALELAVNVLAQVAELGGKAGEDEVFKIQEMFHLFDVDFFDLKPGDKKRLSYRDDVRELAALVKTFATRTIGSDDMSKEQAQELYQKHFENLPDSRAMWRLRLYVLSLQPEYFKDKLKEALFHLFDEDKYHEIISGAEYERTLERAFPAFSDDEQRKYVAEVIEYFKKEDESKENEKQDWHLRHGSEILTVIWSHLTPDEREKAEEAGFIKIEGYEPEPSIGEMRGGTVSPRGPISQEEFSALSIEKIAQNLRSEWSPEQLKEKFKDDDFLRPRNAEGAGSLLQADIAQRLDEYVANARFFFEKDALDSHYTYTFLRGVQEAIKKDKETASHIDWSELIEMLKSIKNTGLNIKREKRDTDSFDAWLAGWTAVHIAIDDVIQALLEEEDGKSVIKFDSFRDDLLAVIHYLLLCPDPTPEDEEPKTAKMTSQSPGDSAPAVSDPFTRAINTVRGRAFQAFVLFVYHDGKEFNKDTEVKIKQDVKDIYEEVLGKENTRAIMFMFGHYIPAFYFRHIEWIHSLLPQIFPEDTDKSHLYHAAWEGYLTNNLFKEIFEDPEFQDLYKRGIREKVESDPQRKHLKDPDEGLAVHLALAFMHFDGFDFDHELFEMFWREASVERKANFVSFIGRMFISGDNANANKLLEEDKSARQRIRTLWDYVLENYSDKEIFTQMGFWINLEKGVFETQWLAEHLRDTLKKTGGEIGWDYGLTKTISTLAKEAPEATLEIAELHLLEYGVRNQQLLMPFRIESEWYEAFQTLYEKTPEKTYKLIDDLIREGGQLFWQLKKILE